MAYTTIDDPEKLFQCKLYTGNGSTQSITFDGTNDLQPNMNWTKVRSETGSHRLTDDVRGLAAPVFPNGQDQEGSEDNYASFDSDGFSLKNNSVNENTRTYASWCWKTGTAFSNDASSTSVGTIDSVGSFNNDSGFSIVTYSGTGSNGTIKHGLNSVPKIIFWKRRDNNAGGVNWIVQSTLFGNQTKLVLNTTEAFSTGSAFSQTDNWTSALIDLKTYEGQNASNGTYVAYCFAEKKGFSKIGSYAGNGHASDGPYIYLGFRPAFVLTKKTDGTDDWRIFDNKRSSSGFNPVDKHIYPYSSGAEAASSTNSAPDGCDFLANGFKIRQASAGINADGGAYIFVAFAESPFVNSNKVPNNAR